MREMKDSGIEWIDEIPNNWEVIKLKYVCNEISESGIMNSEVDYYIGLENVSSYSNQLVVTGTEYENSVQKVCHKGNVLFGKLRPYLSKVIIAPFNGYCTGEFLELANFKGDIRFLRYSMLNPNFIDKVNMSTYGAKMPRANSEFILNLCIAYPAIYEQTRIANFLDGKCAEIDGLIADIQEQIDTLEQYKRSVITEAVTKGLNPNAEMKDSGVGYIGNYPIHWNIGKLKYHLHRKTEKNHPNAEVLSLYRELGVIPKNSRDDNHNVTSEDTSKYLYVRDGDFVVNKMKAWQGSVAVSNYNGIISPAYFTYTFTDKNIIKQYFHYLMRNQLYIPEYRRLSGGIREGQWDLPDEALDNLLILIPPLEEQKAIAEYLDNKCAEIETCISEKQEQLETLENYKKSIIFEYVTGKKEVANY